MLTRDPVKAVNVVKVPNWESSAVSAYLSRRQRLWDTLMKHWRRMALAVDELAAEDPALGLELALLVQDEAHGVVDHMVLKMRAEGASWEDVGSVLRVSKQSAHRRFRHLEDEHQADGDPAA